MLVDSHCHLDFPVLAADRDALIARARAAGVGTMLTIGTKLSAFEGVRAVAAAYDGIYCSVGIHPHEAEAEPDVQAAQLLGFAGDPKVVAFGETGLDYYYEHAPREAQKANFRAHIEAARSAGLPVIVHTRDADEDTEALLTQEMGKGAFTGVLHCFTSGERLARAAVDLGFYISFSGILTFKKTEALQAIARELPHQPHAVDLRQAQVDEDDVDRLALAGDALERLAAVGRVEDGAHGDAAQQAHGRTPLEGIVLHDQHAQRVERSGGKGHGAGVCAVPRLV